MRRRYVRSENEGGIFRPFIRFKGVKHYLEYRKGDDGKDTGELCVIIQGDEKPVENGYRWSWRFFKKFPAKYVKF